MKIYAFNINGITYNGKLKALWKVISNEKKMRIRKVVSTEEQKRILGGELLLRYGIEDYLGVKNADIKIGKNAFGKPYLENIPYIFFNISHSGEWVVCGIADSKIGIDIEQITSINWRQIAKRFFLPYEYQQTKNKEVFFKIWTLKESYAKFVGKGLFLPFDSFGFILDGDNIRFSTLEKVFFWSDLFYEKYWLSICSETPIDFVDIKKITIKDLGLLLK